YRFRCRGSVVRPVCVCVCLCVCFPCVSFFLHTLYLDAPKPDCTSRRGGEVCVGYGMVPKVGVRCISRNKDQCGLNQLSSPPHQYTHTHTHTLKNTCTMTLTHCRPQWGSFHAHTQTHTHTHTHTYNRPLTKTPCW